MIELDFRLAIDALQDHLLAIESVPGRPTEEQVIQLGALLNEARQLASDCRRICPEGHRELKMLEAMAQNILDHFPVFLEVCVVA